MAGCNALHGACCFSDLPCSRALRRYRERICKLSYDVQRFACHKRKKLVCVLKHLNNVTRQQADIGAREQYVQMLRQQSDANLTATQSRQSQLENVDLAAAILDEKTAENANQAALAMAGRVGQISLLNYLQ